MSIVYESGIYRANETRGTNLGVQWVCSSTGQIVKLWLSLLQGRNNLQVLLMEYFYAELSIEDILINLQRDLNLPIFYSQNTFTIYCHQRECLGCLHLMDLSMFSYLQVRECIRNYAPAETARCGILNEPLSSCTQVIGRCVNFAVIVHTSSLRLSLAY